jgi:hypothetical protein
VITLNDARKIIAAAEQKAKELGQPMNIAIAMPVQPHCPRTHGRGLGRQH